MDKTIQLVGSNGLYGRWSLESCLKAQKELGYALLAFYQTPAHLWLDHERCVGMEKLERSLKEGGFRLSSFHPGRYQYSLYAPEESLQGRASDAYFQRCIDVASALQCPYVSIQPMGGVVDEDAEKNVENLVRRLRGLCDYAERRKVRICLQTVPVEAGGQLHTLEELEAVLTQIEGLNATLDTVALSCADENILQWFERIGEKIRTVIFRDGRGTTGRLWGEGVFPVEQYVSQLLKCGYRGPVSLNGFTDRYQDAPADADAKNRCYIDAVLKKI